MHNQVQSIIDETVRRVVAEFKPKKIILFGSHASGNAGPDSDLDWLFVMDVAGSTRQKANEIDMLMFDRTIPMDFLVVTPEQFERQKRLIGNIVRQADLEGRVVYEQAA